MCARHHDGRMRDGARSGQLRRWVRSHGPRLATLRAAARRGITTTQVERERRRLDPKLARLDPTQTSCPELGSLGKVKRSARLAVRAAEREVTPDELPISLQCP